MPYALLLVDDCPPRLSDGLAWIEQAPDLEIRGHVSATDAALQALADATPDLVLICSSLAETDRIGLVTTIRSDHPAVPVMVVSHHRDDAHIARAIRAGARGYVSHESSPEAVLAAIRSVLTGHVVLPESARPHLLPDRQTALNGTSIDSLSARQLEVLRGIGEGLTTTEIAHRLDISPKTVETHRVHIKTKLGLGTANALIRWAALWVESVRD